MKGTVSRKAKSTCTPGSVIRSCWSSSSSSRPMRSSALSSEVASVSTHRGVPRAVAGKHRGDARLPGMATTRTVVVTGSASGMGAATKARLEADGQRVIGVDLRDADVTADLGIGRRPAGRDRRGARPRRWGDRRSRDVGGRRRAHRDAREPARFGQLLRERRAPRGAAAAPGERRPSGGGGDQLELHDVPARSPDGRRGALPGRRRGRGSCGGGCRRRDGHLPGHEDGDRVVGAPPCTDRRLGRCRHHAQRRGPRRGRDAVAPGHAGRTR